MSTALGKLPSRLEIHAWRRRPLSDCREEIVQAALAGPQQGFGEVEAYPTIAAKAAVHSTSQSAARDIPGTASEPSGRSAIMRP